MYKLEDITINGKTYDWRMISITANIDFGNGSESIIFNGVTALNYSQNRESQWNNAIGGLPYSKGYGNLTAEATITMAAFELDRVKLKMSGGTISEDSITPNERYIQNINMFKLSVTYNFDDGTSKTDVIMNCSFDTDSAGASQGDMFITTDINLDPSHIIFDTPPTKK